MKFYVALLVALPLLALSSAARDQLSEVQGSLPPSEEEVTSVRAGDSPVANQEYDYEDETGEVDEDVQSDEPSSTIPPHVIRDADDEAAKERRRLANLHRRFTLPFFRNHGNGSSESLPSEELSTEEQDETEVYDDPEEQVEEGNKEEAIDGDDAKPDVNRPRRLGRFGGRQQADESELESTRDNEESGIPEDSSTGVNDRPHRPRRFGRFGGRQQADESESESISNNGESEIQEDASLDTNDKPYRQRPLGRVGSRRQANEPELKSIPNNEESEIQEDTSLDFNERPYRQRRLGRFGSRRQPDEPELESIPNNEGGVSDESDHSARSTTEAPVGRLANLLSGRFSSSRTQSNQSEDVNEDGAFEVAPSGDEDDVDYTADQGTPQKPTGNVPRRGWLRSRFQSKGLEDEGEPVESS